MTFVRIPREQSATADLTLDAVYEGGRAGNSGDDPLGPLLGVSNQGGFRHLGRRERPHLLVITTSMIEPDWPDSLDLETGLFTYYGDNRKPGLDLHGTPRWGNQMLRDLFDRSHAIPPEREAVPPILVFRTAGSYRDVRFLGLAVPGAAGLSSVQDLVAIWRHVSGQRFQNYKSIFTILNVGTITRLWIDDIRSGTPVTSNAPVEWLAWIKSGQPSALRSTPTVTHRTKNQQLPDSMDDQRMLAAIHRGFRERPHEFEGCAATLAEMLLPGIVSVDLTRPARDGGRDAIGRYRIGSDATAIEVDFALEAKCYQPENSVGIKETSRLISRLRHRQFGILVTTSYVNTQAYKEIQEDRHPVLIICGSDIVAILKRAGIRDTSAVDDWLSGKFTEPSKRSVL
ncbi:MAG TPA: restriction endonuclease [Candidatus Acidoferrales bacterium]|nr:restriction endonuclease [Candidatus Acidoferrales bacterium]